MYFSDVRDRVNCHIDHLGIRVEYNRVELICSALGFCCLYNARVVAVLLGRALL